MALEILRKSENYGTIFISVLVMAVFLPQKHFTENLDVRGAQDCP